MYTEENRPVTEKESHNKNSDAAFRTIFRISSVFKGTSRNFNIIFLSKKVALKI
jgi:hypothetical protein